MCEETQSSPKPTEMKLLTSQTVVIDEGPSVEYSSTPPSPSGSFSSPANTNNTASQAEMQALRDELELSSYEYAVLEERYRTLGIKHSELHKLATVYNSIIRGFASQEDVTVSIEQLSAEAGNDGLRAKALEADALTPLVQEAGGLDNFIAQVESLQALIDSVGGLQELQDAVEEAHMLGAEVDHVGGLQGLSSLTAEVKYLRVKQHDKGKARAVVDEPEVLKAKASKYDRLQQAFAAIKDELIPSTITGRSIIQLPLQAHSVAKTSEVAHSSNLSQDSVRVHKGGEETGKNIGTTRGRTPKVGLQTTPKPSIPDAAATIHPARARMLSTTPHDDIHPARARMLSTTPQVDIDPDRDLYEAPRPFRTSLRKTGSNDVPLGSSGITRLSPDRGQVEATRKRRYIDEPQTNAVAKRPRIDVGRASAMVNASLDQVKATPSTSNVILHKPSTWLSIAEQSFKSGQSSLGAPVPSSNAQSSKRNNPWHAHVDELLQECVAETMPASAISPVITQSATRPSSGGRISGYADRAASKDSSRSIRSPVVKDEDMGDDMLRTIVPYYPRPKIRSAEDAKVTVGGCPIALWVGSGKPGPFTGDNLKNASEIPSDLAFYLSRELLKYINSSDLRIWDTMPPTPDTCVLRYVFDGHRPSGRPQERRACSICSSAWGGPSRPCALLQDLESVLTIVFLPLCDIMRGSGSWKKRQYWINGTQ